ncbi:conserved hypothetical protein [Phenylobacterium zucineum HLK1]|uniref:Thioesterase domain-containing protein n=1 Tax=Phenylobacterium zucineum (strain HLK1) TaxID=450851 RepID=B4RGM6_PHEZH|nr:PaaI family thioesterase [Phenylobacterium zucineum]ACG78932.1 conserved hypothetical protein [Phenylobacterium zucineum HLK1]
MSRGTDTLDSIVRGEARPQPVHETLRLGGVDAWGENWVRKVWRPTPEVLFADGRMFGGYIAALADQMLAYSAYTVIPEGRAFTTVNLQVQMLGQARGQPLVIEARVAHANRSIISTECELRRLDDNGLVAKAVAQQLVIPLQRLGTLGAGGQAEATTSGA